jgi:hypothetical protein
MPVAFYLFFLVAKPAASMIFIGDALSGAEFLADAFFFSCLGFRISLLLRF